VISALSERPIQWNAELARLRPRALRILSGGRRGCPVVAESDREDVWQEAQLRLVRAYERAGPRASLDAVLERAVTSAAVDHLRRAGALKRPGAAGDEAPAREPASDDEVHADVAEADGGRVVANAIAIALPRLTDEEQRVLVLRLRHDLSMREIGDHVGRAKSFCHKTFRAACDKLRPDLLEVRTKGLSTAQEDLLFRRVTRQGLTPLEIEQVQRLASTAAGRAHVLALRARLDAVVPLLPAVETADRHGLAERVTTAVTEVGRGARSLWSGLLGRGAEGAAAPGAPALAESAHTGGGVAAGLLAGAGGAKAVVACLAAGAGVTACVAAVGGGAAVEPKARPVRDVKRVERPHGGGQARAARPAVASVAPRRASAVRAPSIRRASSRAARRTLQQAAVSRPAAAPSPAARPAAGERSRTPRHTEAGGGEFTSSGFEQASAEPSDGAAPARQGASSPRSASASSPPAAPASGGEFDASGFETP